MIARQDSERAGGREPPGPFRLPCEREEDKRDQEYADEDRANPLLPTAVPPDGFHRLTFVKERSVVSALGL